MLEKITFLDRDGNERTLSVGQRVKVDMGAWSDPRFGTVDEVSYDIKNGEPGFAYTGTRGESWWAYVDQLMD